MMQDETDRLAYARSRSVMICTPVYRDCAWQYTRSLVDTCVALERLGIRHRAQFVIGNSHIARARNQLCAEFLASDCDDLLFIDSDMGWAYNDVLRLLASEHPVIGGVGRKRSGKPNSDLTVWCMRLLPGALQQDSMGAIEVAAIGTGFLKISRGALATLIATGAVEKAHGGDGIDPEIRAYYHRFFRFSDDAHEMGEDYAFCAAWREIGGSIWADPEIALVHAGTTEFKGSIAELFVTDERDAA